MTEKLIQVNYGCNMQRPDFEEGYNLLSYDGGCGTALLKPSQTPVLRKVQETNLRTMETTYREELVVIDD